GSFAVTNSLENRYGGEWRVHSWNAQTGTPHFVYGTAAKVTNGFSSRAGVESVARQVIADNMGILRAKQADLRLTETPHALGKWAAHFQQTYQGLDVWNSKVRLVFSDAGDLMLMGSDFHSEINLETSPHYGLDRAKEIARMALPYDRTTDSVEAEGTLLVLPVAVTAEQAEYHLVWRVRVHTDAPLGNWVTHVDAHTGEIIWRYNDIHFSYGGTTESDTEPGTYCDGVVQETVPYLRVQVSSVGTVITDAAGDWNINGSGGSRTVTADLYGPYVDLNNYNGSEGAFDGTVYDGVPLQVYFDDTNSRADERDVFDGVNDIHDFFELVDPGYSYSNTRINAYINRTDGYCPGNAWWDGTINFCAGSSTYGNTGQIQGVVQHEFGHGVQANLLGWQGDQGLGEGNSDILANLLTQDSHIGRGFYIGNCSSGIRNSLNSLVYPDDVVGVAIHAAGQVIAGFNWDAMVMLQDLYNEEQGTLVAAANWHFGRKLLQPTTQPDQVLATFVADDDDNDLDNGTPHHAIYCEAATNHGFECPEILTGVRFTHTPLADTEDTQNGYLTSVEIWSTEDDIDNSTAILTYRVGDGPWMNLALNQGLGNIYTVTIPAQSISMVEYYFSAEDVIGTSGMLPANAPTATFKFAVAWEADALEVASGWTVGDTGDAATSGVWERVDPVGTVYQGFVIQPEDDHTPDSGVMCFITENSAVGGTPGSADVDGGKTTLFTPVYDLSDALECTISYWKYYTNSHGYNPNSDYWDVDISNDGGGSWVSIEHTVDDSSGWENVSFDLADHFAVFDQVQLRFIAADDSDGSLIDAGVDDLAILALFGGTGIGDDVTVSFTPQLSQNHPNPFNPTTKISFSLPEAGLASLKVFDANGRLVKVLNDGHLVAGEHTLTWDGSDEQGHRLSSGVYFYRLRAENINLSKRMILVK
ncbi:MAG: T9SS type A sorting domain-containing protein, partial [bacterium]|nr:T9SS type A sorting domain-containing protein [bacterium]